MSAATDASPLHERTGVRVALAVLLVLSLAYALLVAQQILLWVVVVLVATALWYVARLVVAIEQIASHLGRLVEVQSEGSRRDDE